MGRWPQFTDHKFSLSLYRWVYKLISWDFELVLEQIAEHEESQWLSIAVPIGNADAPRRHSGELGV